MEYWVLDNQEKTMHKRTIHTHERQDYYVVSFGSGSKEQQDNKPKANDLWITSIPNPSSGYCTIKYRVPVQSRVKISVYDLFGQQLNVLQEGVLDEGIYSLEYNGTTTGNKQLDNGMYIVSIKAGKDKSQTKLLIIN
jgi:hypothetical protein